jgi:hypothetical protein
VSAGVARGSVPARASLAFDNLRGVVILFVVGFHSVLAYLDFLPTTRSSFNDPPYLWRAFPIIDTERWVGFDLFCASQDVLLMSLFFFLSGLFVWPSLEREGVRRFLYDRLMRLGVPFLLVVGLLMPLASYPTYLQTAPGARFPGILAAVAGVAVLGERPDVVFVAAAGCRFCCRGPVQIRTTMGGCADRVAVFCRCASDTISRRRVDRLGPCLCPDGHRLHAVRVGSRLQAILVSAQPAVSLRRLLLRRGRHRRIRHRARSCPRPREPSSGAGQPGSLPHRPRSCCGFG